MGCVMDELDWTVLVIAIGYCIWAVVHVLSRAV